MMKNITLSADEQLIRQAREKAARENRALNTLFREWLQRYVGNDKAAAAHHEVLQRLSYVRVGQKFSREEMNER